MPAIQSTFLLELAVALQGSISNLEPNRLISRDVQTAAIGFGKVVKQGTLAEQVLAATAAADIVRGITCRDQSVPGAADEFPVGFSALIMTHGVIWVRAGAACTVGTAVYMVVGTAEAGNFTSTATSNLPIPGAIFDTTAATGELVKVRLG